MDDPAHRPVSAAPPVRKRSPSKTRASTTAANKRRPKTQQLGKSLTSAALVAAEDAAALDGDGRGRAGAASAPLERFARDQRRAGSARAGSARAAAAPQRAPPPRPASPFPTEVLCLRHSTEPLLTVDLSQWNAYIDDETARTIASSNRRFHELIVRDSEQLVDVQCIAMGHAFGERLVRLNLSGCPWLTDVSIKSFTQAQKAAPHLRGVELSGCAQLTDSSLRALATCLTTRLERIGVANCVRLTDHGMLGLTQMCSAITSIDVSGCAALTDRTIASFGQQLKVIDINLSCCPKLSDNGMGKFLAGCSQLRCLRCRDCENVTDVGMRNMYEIEVTWGFKKNGGCSQLDHIEVRERV
jgi:hypothetical protein